MLFANAKTHVALGLISLFLSNEVQARYQWLERDGRAVFLYPRRFGQERPAVIDKLSNACGGGVCASLAGQAITPLLAAQPECSQQDMADLIIDTAQQFDDATKATMIQLAIEYRQAEKNTPPDFSANPPINRNSVFCQKAPKNAELNGLVQAQDPANDPNIFFDPATKASVEKGAQANTFPFGSDNSAPSNPSPTVPVSSPAASSPTPEDDNVDPDDSEATCPPPTTVTVTGTANPLPTGPAATVTVGTSIPLIPAPTSPASAVGNFGSCTLPQIEFGVGFDNRKETSFQPVDKDSYDHESAQNIDIITEFICDTLVNSCDADEAARNTCATAKAAASQLPPKTGAQADAFNAVFGITTNFAQVAAVDNQGNIVPGSTSGNGGNDDTAPITAPGTGATATPTSPSQAGPTSTGSSGGSSGIGNFGSCSVPEIEFGAGFDGRRETSFQPADKASFNHGSAQNINIITQSICDQLTNSCKADQTAKDTCAKATAAASAAAAGTGAQADAFNAAFGITTDFANVAAVDNQGRIVSGAGAGAGAVVDTQPAQNNAPARTSQASAPPAATSAPTVAAVGGNLQTFAGALGGVTAPAVTALANGQFQVAGNSAFKDISGALTRSCDVQHNQCANAANASGNKGDLTVAACGVQQTQCNASR
ncbi:hypothetical protein BXZ70DRAFT_1008447 [Cristinia sonorae]|uniref:Uncharacterized protein n=1 Tax=Cristinia sonorae TaxID=1940300 RepID=A0A8K0XPS9_9AGAR|nr:hypothetical protein BXZ70DRAFT_1008447 [Cristinia sonorae]